MFKIGVETDHRAAMFGTPQKAAELAGERFIYSAVGDDGTVRMESPTSSSDFSRDYRELNEEELGDWISEGCISSGNENLPCSLVSLLLTFDHYEAEDVINFVQGRLVRLKDGRTCKIEINSVYQTVIARVYG